MNIWNQLDTGTLPIIVTGVSLVMFVAGLIRLFFGNKSRTKYWWYIVLLISVFFFFNRGEGIFWVYDMRIPVTPEQ